MNVSAWTGVIVDVKFDITNLMMMMTTTMTIMMLMTCYQLAITLDTDIQSIEEMLLGDDRVSIQNCTHSLPFGVRSSAAQI